MKKLNYFLFVAVLLFSNSFIFSQSFVYISPKNNSMLVSLSTNIILKSSDIIDPASLSQNEFSVSGIVSGEHKGSVKLSDDNKTILFIPAAPFSANEGVSVNVNKGIKSIDGAALPAVAIYFKTTPLSKTININPLTLMSGESLNQPASVNKIYKSIAKTSETDTTTPPTFPVITVNTSNNPASGNIFLANDAFIPSTQFGNFVMILNNDGSAAKYKNTGTTESMDFTVQPNGQLSYAQLISANTINSSDLMVAVRWIVMDTSFTPVDTFQCGNGYASVTDVHDFLLLPNGHALVFASDPELVDMSQFGGSPNATVIGAVIQELDASKNVVFQWRSWDYLPITDSYMDLTTSTVDLFHGNSLEVDVNGNILFSMRHTSSVIKVDRQTGNVDWILGGKRNQFNFYNEHQSNYPNYFSFQHDVKEIPDSNGYITIFDNGNQHPTPYSRAVEYKLDEQNLTATLVWEYTHTPVIYSTAMGSVQRLSNGNTLIGWGYASLLGLPAVTEIHSDLSTALEFHIPGGQISYRAYKFPWVSQIPEAKVTPLGGILQGNTYKFNKLDDTTGITIKFDSLNTLLYANATVSSYNYAPVNPAFNTEAPIMVSNYFNISSGMSFNYYLGEVQVNLYNYPAVTNPKATVVYARSNSDNNFIPLPTSYNSAKDEITFTTSTLGDFAFGIPQVDSLYSPVQITPKDSQFVFQSAPVELVWGTRGIVQKYHLQVSSNASFSGLVVDNSSLDSTSFILGSVNNNSTYYWRVNNTNAAGTSAWSNTEIFNTAPAFIKMLSPNGGEKFYLDSTYIIRWESNINDTVNIKLMEGNNIASVIGDTIVAGTNAYQWQVPSNLKQDSSYIIIVSGITNDLYGSSNSAFTISPYVTGIKSVNNTVKSYQLFQNYPNPFNPSTVINYSIPEESHVRIDVFNVIGQRVSTLVNSSQKSGNYSISWNASDLASGVYFYSIRASDNSGKTFFSVKKTMLLK